MGTCTWRGQSRSHPTPPPLLGNRGLAPLAPRPPPGMLQARLPRGPKGTSCPPSLSCTCPPTSKCGSSRGRYEAFYLEYLEGCVAVKRISPEMTEIRVRSSANVGNQWSTAATVLMLS